MAHLANRKAVVMDSTALMAVSSVNNPDAAADISLRVSKATHGTRTNQAGAYLEANV